MTATINQCLTELKTLMDAAALANIVYDYRTFPGKLTTAVTLSYQGGNPNGGGTTGGNAGYYDMVAVCMVQTTLNDSGTVTETNQRSAEQTLNTLESAVYALLGKGGAANRGTYWINVAFPTPSLRPPSPVEAPATRWANIPFRLILK